MVTDHVTDHELSSNTLFIYSFVCLPVQFSRRLWVFGTGHWVLDEVVERPSLLFVSILLIFQEINSQ